MRVLDRGAQLPISPFGWNSWQEDLPLFAKIHDAMEI
jgi:hypothetical protein